MHFENKLKGFHCPIVTSLLYVHLVKCKKKHRVTYYVVLETYMLHGKF